MKYKVTNLSKDERKFRDKNGKDVLIEPNKSVITESPPKESEVWKVHVEKTEENIIKKEVTSKKMKKNIKLGEK